MFKEDTFYLFDFDGVLVDTEALHLKAYQMVCSNRGFDLTWTQHDYAKVALFSASGLKEAIYSLFPKLYEQEPSWDVLYKEKRAIYTQLLEARQIDLMPGVEQLLAYLQQQGIISCVVTNSPLEHIEKIKAFHPILSTIAYWITRECYQKPKPDPECYHLAISLYAQDKKNIIGFEDSPRGMMALSQTRASPYLITSFLSSEQVIDCARQAYRPFTHLPTLVDYLHQAKA